MNLISVRSQIIKIDKNDSIKLTKIADYIDYIIPAQINEYNYKEYAGGRGYCEKCKKETYRFRIRKINFKPSSKYKSYTTDTLFKNLNRYSFGDSYFLIDGFFYKNLGMPVE